MMAARRSACATELAQPRSRRALCVRLAAGTPQGLGLWAYLARLTNLRYQPFGSNPHTGLVLT